jgi:type IV secretion system protein VirB3
VLGGDRELVLFSLVIAGGLVFAGQNVVSIIVAAVLWFGVVAALRQIAKADPQMRPVYLRHRDYAGYYPARSRPARINPTDKRDRRKAAGWQLAVWVIGALVLWHFL